LYSDQSGSVSFIALDALGSNRADVSSAGTVVGSRRYQVYGAVAIQSGQPPSVLAFTGEIRDENGLVYLRNRWYDPVVGRFVSSDPYSGTALGPTTLNRYVYAEANPARFTDPSGLCVDPGGPGVRYCVDRFIPSRFACPFPYPCGTGDNRGTGSNTGDESYRVRQLIRSDGGVQSHAGISGLGFFGWFPRRGTLEGCTEQAQPGDVRVSCTAYNGYSGAPGSPGPIGTQVQIYESEGRVTVSAFGTLYPSLEVWQYGGSARPQLLFFYDASAVDIWSLQQQGQLRNSAPK